MAELPGGAGAGMTFAEPSISSQRIAEGLAQVQLPPSVGSIRAEVLSAGLGWLGEHAASEPAPLKAGEDFLDTLRRSIGAAIDPESTVLKRTAARVRLPGGVSLSERVGDPLEPLLWAPSFDDPMYAPLRDISHQLLLPGVETIPDNTSTLLVVNWRFLRSYLVGLSWALGVEFQWRGLLMADQRATYARQFWDVSDFVPAPEQLEADGTLKVGAREALRDIRPIHAWGASKLGDPMAPVVPGVAPMPDPCVVCLKADLLRRFPDPVVYAVNAVKKGTRTVPDLPGEVDAPGPAIGSLFGAVLPPDIAFYGFPFDKEAAVGFGQNLGKYIVIEERPDRPRFGLDEADGRRCTSVNDLAWSTFGMHGPESVGKYLDAAEVNPPGGEWGDAVSSATRASLTFQQPMRVAIHASLMLPK